MSCCPAGSWPALKSDYKPQGETVEANGMRFYMAGKAGDSGKVSRNVAPSRRSFPIFCGGLGVRREVAASGAVSQHPYLPVGRASVSVGWRLVDPVCRSPGFLPSRPTFCSSALPLATTTISTSSHRPPPNLDPAGCARLPRHLRRGERPDACRLRPARGRSRFVDFLCAVLPDDFPAAPPSNSPIPLPPPPPKTAWWFCQTTLRRMPWWT